MRLKYNFEYMDFDGEIMAVPVGPGSEKFHGMLTINDTAKEILELIKVYDTPEMVEKKLLELHPDEDRVEVGNKLCDFLNRLLREGLLDP